MIGPFLIKLVEQPEVFGQYLRDPEGAMDAEGLSSGEREILFSGDLRRLREALQREYPDRDVFLGHVPPMVGVFGHVPQTRPPGTPDESDPGQS